MTLIDERSKFIIVIKDGNEKSYWNGWEIQVGKNINVRILNYI